jgi:alpha-ketoglutarate-dependent taurine dioxygenase
MLTKEFIDNLADGIFDSGLAFQSISDFDADKFVSLVGNGIVKTKDKDYEIIMEGDDPTDFSNRTQYFHWHSDGLYREIPPRFVLFHCLHPGNGKAMTELASVRCVFSAMSPANVAILKKLNTWYIGHMGMFYHKMISRDGVLLASRGYQAPLAELELENVPEYYDIVAAMTDFYNQLEKHAVSFHWSKGNTLVFNQRLYLHRRNSAVTDYDRKLVRMWFNHWESIP